MANYSEPFLKGHSCAFNQTGRKMLVADSEEGIHIAEFESGTELPTRAGL